MFHIALIDGTENRTPRGVEHFDTYFFSEAQEGRLGFALVQLLNSAPLGDAS